MKNCTKIVYYVDSRKMSRNSVKKLFNSKNKKHGLVAVKAEPSTGGVVHTGRGPVVPFVLTVCGSYTKVKGGIRVSRRK